MSRELSLSPGSAGGSCPGRACRNDCGRPAPSSGVPAAAPGGGGGAAGSAGIATAGSRWPCTVSGGSQNAMPPFGAGAAGAGAAAAAAGSAASGDRCCRGWGGAGAPAPALLHHLCPGLADGRRGGGAGVLRPPGPARRAAGLRLRRQRQLQQAPAGGHPERAQPVRCHLQPPARAHAGPRCAAAGR